MARRTTLLFISVLLLTAWMMVIGGALLLLGSVQEGWTSNVTFAGYNPPSAFKPFFYKYNLNKAASSTWCGSDDGTCTGGILADTSPSIGPGAGAMINASGQCQDGVPPGDRAICECYQLQKQHQDGSVQFTQASSPFCVPCPEGAVCPNPREHWCKPNYQPAASGFGCEACPAGQTSPGGSKTNLNGGKCATPTCQPGQYLPSGTTTCAECPTGSMAWRNTSSDPWSCVKITCQDPGSTSVGWFDITMYPSNTHWTGQTGCDVQLGETCEVPDAARLSAAAKQIAAGGTTGAQVYTNMMCRRSSTPGGGSGGGGSGPAPAPRPSPGSFTPSGKYVACCGSGAYGQGGNAIAPASSVWVWSSKEAAQEKSTDSTDVIYPNPIPSGPKIGCDSAYDGEVNVKEVSLEWLDARETSSEWPNPCVCSGSVIQNSSTPWCSAGLHTQDGGPNPTSSICASGSGRAPKNC